MVIFFFFSVRKVAGSSQTPGEEHSDCGKASRAFKCRNGSWTLQTGTNSLQWVKLLSFSLPSLHNSCVSDTWQAVLGTLKDPRHGYKSCTLLKCKFFNPNGVCLSFMPLLGPISLLCACLFFSMPWLHFSPSYCFIPISSHPWCLHSSKMLLTSFQTRK